MPWPWVGRGERDRRQALEEQVCELLEETARLTRDLASERDRYERLIGQVLELKREGFMPPVRPEMLDPQIPNVPDQVQRAIAQRAMPNSDLERDLLRWAVTALRREGAEPEMIAGLILRGGGISDEEA